MYVLQIEERISISVLDELKQAFHLADADGDAAKLDFNQFKAILKAQLNIAAARVGKNSRLSNKLNAVVHWVEFS